MEVPAVKHITDIEDYNYAAYKTFNHKPEPAQFKI